MFTKNQMNMFLETKILWIIVNDALMSYIFKVRLCSKVVGFVFGQKLNVC